MSDKEPVDKMIAEGLREIGVLIIVFANLDKLVAGTPSFGWVLAAVGIGTGFFIIGVYIERTRKE